MAIDEPSRSLRSQLKFSDRIKSKSALIIGEDELKNKLLNLKLMESGKELKLEYQGLKNLANIDWEELKSHLQTPGFAYAGREYEQTLVQNRDLLKLLKIYFNELNKLEA